MSIQIPKMPPPSTDALRELESWLGLGLPASYVDFVREHDGAKPEANSLFIENNEVGVRRFIPVSEAAALAEEIDGFPADAVPLAEDDCGNYLYVEPRSGRICFWDHEIDGHDEVIAEDVPALVRKLTPFDATRVKLAPGQVKRVWIDPTFKPEF